MSGEGHHQEVEDLGVGRGDSECGPGDGHSDLEDSEGVLCGEHGVGDRSPSEHDHRLGQNPGDGERGKEGIRSPFEAVD